MTMKRRSCESATRRDGSTRIATWRNNAQPLRAPARPDAVLQRRGLERMRVILDTAEQILSEEGYEAATLKAIGTRAGIPTASLYHYFLDRSQVEMQLLIRHIDRLDAFVVASLGDGSRLGSLRQVVDAVIDPMVDYLRGHPGCVELWFGRHISGHADIAQAYDQATAERVYDLVIEHGLLATSTPNLVMDLAFEVGAHLFEVAFHRGSRAGDNATLEEARLILTLYLEAHAPEQKPPSAITIPYAPA